MSFSYGHHHRYDSGWRPQGSPSPTPSTAPAPSPAPYNPGQSQDDFQYQGWGQDDNNQGPPAYVPPAGSWGSSKQVWNGPTPSGYTPSSSYTPASPTPTSPTPTSPTPGDSSNNGPTPAGQSGQALTGTVDGGGPKQLVLKNNDSKPMTIGLFENTGPGMNPNINNPNNQYTLQPGQSIVLSMPDSWQGRAQKITGKADDPATWAELNFEDKNGVSKTWYDESLIRGYNGALTISPTNGNGGVAGSSKAILSGAPAAAIKHDANGNPVIDATELYTGGIDQAAIDYYNQVVGNQNAYVRNYDNGAVRTSDDNSLTVNFYGT